MLNLQNLHTNTYHKVPCAWGSINQLIDIVYNIQSLLWRRRSRAEFGSFLFLSHIRTHILNVYVQLRTFNEASSLVLIFFYTSYMLILYVSTGLLRHGFSPR